MTQKMACVGARLALVTLLTPVLSACTWVGSPQRAQNIQEAAYYDISIDTGTPDLCRKIYPQATHGLGANPRGWQIYYTRSRCLFDVAVLTRDARLCDEVRSLSTLFLDGSKISKEECLESIDGSNDVRGLHPGANLFDAQRILTQMGYTPDMIRPEQLAAADTVEMWMKFYASVAATPEFRARFDRLPDYSTVRGNVASISCHEPYIPTKSPYPPPEDWTCCLDLDGDGKCDGNEAKKEGFPFKDFEIAFAPHRPPPVVCGKEPFDIQVVVRNKGSRHVRKGQTLVDIVNVNPALLGLSDKDLMKPCPEIAPGAEAVVSFPNLVLRAPSDAGIRGLDVRAILSVPSSYGIHADKEVRFESEWHVVCVAEQALETVSDTCTKPYLAMEDPAGPGRRCCLDLDDDARCDRKDWESSTVSDREIGIGFPDAESTGFVRENDPFDLHVTVENYGKNPLSRRSGIVRVMPAQPELFANRASDFIKQLPEVGPGEKAVLTFPRLIYRRATGAPPPSYLGFSAVLCTADGCGRYSASSKRLFSEDAVAGGSGLPPRNARRRPVRGVPREPARIEVGLPAPDFSLFDTEGQFKRLLLLQGVKRAVIVFYRGAESEPCRRQLTDLQSHVEAFRQVDAEVIAISHDTRAMMKELKGELGLTFLMLSDSTRYYSMRFGAREPAEDGAAHPTILVVDKKGIIRYISKTDDDARRPTGDDLVEVLKSL